MSSKKGQKKTREEDKGKESTMKKPGNKNKIK